MKTIGKNKPGFGKGGYQKRLKSINGEKLPDLQKVTVSHGGFRAGAGRKLSGKQQLLLRLNPKTIEVIRKKAGKKTPSDFIEELVLHGS
jgi:hypothetical protein